MATLYTVDRPGRPGRLSTMPRPDGGSALAGELAALAERGVTLVVSLLAEPESDQLGLAEEAEAAERAGLAFRRLPTPDFGVPEPGPAQDLANDLAARLAAGDHVVVHCRGGVGRSSLLAALVLVAEGDAPDQAWARLGDARGRPVPETDEQRAFVRPR
ncbi:MAG: sulfur transferase domain-containing protein [Nocardioides sp.]